MCVGVVHEHEVGTTPTAVDHEGAGGGDADGAGDETDAGDVGTCRVRHELSPAVVTFIEEMARRGDGYTDSRRRGSPGPP